MDSSLHGVPLSAAQMTPKAAPSISGIRAPLTVDESDFEYYSSGLESEGFASGEDEFESASQRPYVSDPDEDVLEETHFLKKYSFSKPFMKKPSENNVEESSDSDEFGISRLSLKNPDEKFHNKNGNVGENPIFGPLMKNPSGDFVQESSNDDEVRFSKPSVKSPDEAFPKMSGNVGGNGVFRPIVRSPDEKIYKGISNVIDSDDTGDEGVEDEDNVSRKSFNRPVVAVMDEEVSENEQILPVMDIKIPLVQKLNVPIAKITGDSDDDSQGSEIFEDVGFSGIARIPSIEVLHRVNSAPKVRILEVDYVDDSEIEGENMVKMDFVDDFGVINGHIDEKDHISDTIQDEGIDAYKEVEKDHLVENGTHDSTSEIVLIDDGVKCVDLVNHVGPVDPSEGTVSGNISYVDSAEVTESENSINFGAVSRDDGTHESSKSVVEDNFVLDQNSESEKFESEGEQKIEKMVVFFSSTSSSKIESFDQDVDKENEHIEMSNSLLIDGDNAFQHVLQGNKLDREAKNEVENIDGEIFKDHVENIDGEILRDSDECEISDHVQTTDMNDDSVHFTASDGIGNLSFERESDDVCPASCLTLNVDLDDHVEKFDGEIVRDSDECEISDHGQITDMDGDSVQFTDSDGIGNLSFERESDDVGPTSPLATNVDLDEALSEGEKMAVKKIQRIRVKYLRFLHRLGRSPEDSVAANVLDRLTLAEAGYYSRASNLDSSKRAAMDENDFDFSLSILVIGKTGVGKSATINSLFDKTTSVIGAFEPTTNKVKEINGMINGIKVKIFDTPGLRTSSIIDQKVNRKILTSIKNVMKKSKPDIILYVDRMDAQSCNLYDLHVVKMITSCLGSSIWRKCIIVLTHANSIPPDGPDGYPLSYEAFVAQCSRDVQKLISRSSMEMMMMVGPGSMILVENHPSDKNVEIWRLDMILLCYSVKILSELNSTVTIDNPTNHKKPFGLEGILVQKSEGPKTISRPENPSFRYCFLEHSLTRPVFDSDPWDQIEGNIVISGRFPSVISTKDNEEFNLELQSSVWMRDKDYPADNTTTLGLSVMRYNGDVILGFNSKTEFCVGRQSRLSVGAGLNDKFSGQICIKISSSDQLQIAGLAFIPIAKAIFKKVFTQNSK